MTVSGLSDEFAAITRRAFTPQLLTTIYNTSPLASSMLRPKPPEKPPEKIMDPLHLTPENKADIRAFVNSHFPDHALKYRDDAREAKLKRLKEEKERIMREQMAQQAQYGYPGGLQPTAGIGSQSASTVTVTTAAAVPQAPYLAPTAISQAAWDQMNMKPGQITSVTCAQPSIYIPFGAMFDTYEGSQGLTLKR